MGNQLFVAEIDEFEIKDGETSRFENLSKDEVGLLLSESGYMPFDCSNYMLYRKAGNHFCISIHGAEKVNSSGFLDTNEKEAIKNKLEYFFGLGDYSSVVTWGYHANPRIAVISPKKRENLENVCNELGIEVMDVFSKDKQKQDSS